MTPFEHKGAIYRSKKHPLLEYIFSKYNPDADTSIAVVPFTLDDIIEGYDACGIPRPTSTSNTILDLTRKRQPIQSRVPGSISSLGYDLRKRTGPTPDGKKYAGEFVFVGVGNEIQSWLVWPEEFDDEIIISSSPIPAEIRQFLRNDEGGLFSVIDYCDVLSQALYSQEQVVLPVQHPIKWQPNEIDGFYYSRFGNQEYVHPVEAKALTTRDDVNLEQLQGALDTISDQLSDLHIGIRPLAVQMITNGLLIAVFRECEAGSAGCLIELERTIRIRFEPEIEAWL